MASKCNLIYLVSAENDILEIVGFHAGQVGAESARKIYQIIRERIGQLQTFPLMGQLHPDQELAAQGYRKLVLTKTYVAIYKVMDGTVMIYRVVNGVTDYPKLLR